jgi:hypothetical protein
MMQVDDIDKAVAVLGVLAMWFLVRSLLGAYGVHRHRFETVAMFPGGNFAERCGQCKLMKMWVVVDGAVECRMIEDEDEQKRLLSVQVSPQDLRGHDPASYEPRAREQRGEGAWWPTRPG